jgi:hypothetical protein
MDPMCEYDVVIFKLAGRARPDEESLADLLNERARAGWRFHSVTPLGPTRMIVVFDRESA